MEVSHSQSTLEQDMDFWREFDSDLTMNVTRNVTVEYVSSAHHVSSTHPPLHAKVTAIYSQLTAALVVYTVLNGWVAGYYMGHSMSNQSKKNIDPSGFGRNLVFS